MLSEPHENMFHVIAGRFNSPPTIQPNICNNRTADWLIIGIK